jgi:hypothetical protein
MQSSRGLAKATVCIPIGGKKIHWSNVVATYHPIWSFYSTCTMNGLGEFYLFIALVASTY